MTTTWRVKTLEQLEPKSLLTSVPFGASSQDTAEFMLGDVTVNDSFKPLSRYPDVIRDSALLLDESVSAEQVMDIITRAKVKYIENAVLFDLYTGKGIPEGKRSIAVRVRYRDLEKTLTDDEVVKGHNKLINSICHQLGAEIR